MSQVKIVIVEDDALQALQMSRDLTSMHYEVLGKATNVKKAEELIRLKSPDLILVDINLTGRTGDRSGISLGKLIQEEYNIPFIYITALEDDETFRDAISVKPQHYIVKPYRKEELYRAIELAMLNFVQVSQPIKQDDFIIVKDNFYLKKIYFKDITWIESERDLKKIYTVNTNRYEVTWATMEELEEKLVSDSFVRVHRSYIVNLDYVKKYKGGFVTVFDHEISVGRAYKDNLHEKLRNKGI